MVIAGPNKQVDFKLAVLFQSEQAVNVTKPGSKKC
jgi:hypothetical protein